MLRLYGLDPEEIKSDLINVAKTRKRLTENFDETLKEGKQAWEKWIGQYKTILAKKSFDDEKRIVVQNKANPAFVLRNYLLEDAIEKAEQGDFSQVETLLNRARKPFETQADKPKLTEAVSSK